ncbi:alpha/beta hydrolase [Hamadaea tsunoensis]|uniref:alpha/beta hydrolase n=1 Tax=Hamadaea tsunoensis TaxID=53368 RepID=UPI000558DB41|nr:alpha/beta hydrolase [Hamadaea tsunoensis]
MDHGIVLVPGAFQGPYAPLLNYVWMAAELRRQARTLAIEWPRVIPDFIDADDVAAWVRSHVEPELDRFAVARPVIAGKSLGAYAAGLAADRGLPAIWLTPHLEQEWTILALRRAKAPFLLVGGTADPVWDGEVARTLTPHVLEVAGANHGMILPKEPLPRSAEVLGRVAAAVESFLDEVWS